MNVKHRRCAEHGCNTRPAFNWKGEEKGAYCNKHKEKGMVNVDKKEARTGVAALGLHVPCYAAKQGFPSENPEMIPSCMHRECGLLC